MSEHRIHRLDVVVTVGRIEWATPAEISVVDFHLDGRDVRRWLDPIERQARGEVGAYLGHGASVDVRGLLEGTWSGDGPGVDGYDGRVALLGCTCGIIGCGPLCVRIEREPGWVVWRDLVRYRGPFFDYAGIAFRFAESAYAAAIDRFEAAHGQ